MKFVNQKEYKGNAAEKQEFTTVQEIEYPVSGTAEEVAIRKYMTEHGVDRLTASRVILDEAEKRDFALMENDSNTAEVRGSFYSLDGSGEQDKQIQHFALKNGCSYQNAARNLLDKG